MPLLAIARGLRAIISSGDEQLFFSPQTVGTESALILCELYHHDGALKVRAIGQGYDSGLAGVATEFGIEIEDDSEAISSPAVEPKTSPAPSPEKISLSKVPLGAVKLTKSAAAKIPLTKADQGSLLLICSLRWDGRGRGDSDLDLYALFIDDDLTEKVCYYKQKGSLKKAPWMKLSGDSRSAGEEVITVLAGKHRHVLFCAYSAVGNGTGAFSEYKAHVVVDDGQGSQITVPLYSKRKYSYWVAVASLDFTDPAGVLVQQVEQYGKNFSEKRPVLDPDGSFVMSAGKIEFKRR